MKKLLVFITVFISTISFCYGGEADSDTLLCSPEVGSCLSGEMRGYNTKQGIYMKGGHVGINNDNPNEVLDVNGNIKTNGSFIGNSVSAAKNISRQDVTAKGTLKGHAIEAEGNILGKDVSAKGALKGNTINADASITGQDITARGGLAGGTITGQDITAKGALKGNTVTANTGVTGQDITAKGALTGSKVIAEEITVSQSFKINKKSVPKGNSQICLNDDNTGSNLGKNRKCDSKKKKIDGILIKAGIDPGTNSWPNKRVEALCPEGSVSRGIIVHAKDYDNKVIFTFDAVCY